MTRCELLQKKIDLCMSCALRTTGYMRAIWRGHAERLKAKMRSMTIKELSEKA